MSQPTPDTRTVDERVAGLEGEVGHLSNQLTELGRVVTKGFERLSNNSKTQWSPLIAAAGIILVVGGAFFALIKADLGRLETQATHNAAQSVDRVRDLDSALQREMRDLDKLATTSLLAQRELLQTEMGWIKEEMREAKEHAVGAEARVAELEAKAQRAEALIELLMGDKIRHHIPNEKP